MISYVIVALLIIVVFLFAVMRHYQSKSKQLKSQLDSAQMTNEQIKTELAHALTYKQIAADNLGLSEHDIDDQLREQGYFRD